MALVNTGDTGGCGGGVLEQAAGEMAFIPRQEDEDAESSGYLGSSLQLRIFSDTLLYQRNYPHVK